MREVMHCVYNVMCQVMAIVSAKGNAFSGGGVTPFASGGILGGPTLFGLRGGLGLAGEAGPEGVLPLKRNGNGDLGVISAGGGGGGTTINLNVTALDAASVAELFQRNGTALADALAGAVSRSADSRSNLRGALR